MKFREKTKPEEGVFPTFRELREIEMELGVYIIRVGGRSSKPSFKIFDEDERPAPFSITADSKERLVLRIKALE